MPQCKANLTELRRLMLGFDLDPARCTRQLTAWSQTCPADSDDIRQSENEILSIFVDICSLFQREPEVDLRNAGEEPSAESYLFSYLRTVETKGEGLPAAFVDALRRALAHYGVSTLDASAKLRESLLWICKSHQRMEQQTKAVLDILEQRLSQASSEPRPNGSFRKLLDRIIVTAREPYPAVSDLAREVKLSLFRSARCSRRREVGVYEEAENHLAYLAAHPDAADRRDRIHALIECPHLLAGLFAGHFPVADSSLRCTMLEILTWRYYKIRTLQNPSSSAVDGPCYVSAEYDHEGKRIHLFATYSDFQKLTAAAQELLPLIAGVPADHDIVLDFHTCHSGKVDDPETTQLKVKAMLNLVAFPRPIRRIVVAVAGASPGHRASGLQHFTYRSTENGYEEEKFYRGLHPMIGKRLHLWRLSNFKIDRLPSIEDVYLLHAVANDNPKDERLFAAAEVRDMTPVRDESGRIVLLPHLERMLMEALAAIRLFQSRRRPQERLYLEPGISLRLANVQSEAG